MFFWETKVTRFSTRIGLCFPFDFPCYIKYVMSPKKKASIKNQHNLQMALISRIGFKNWVKIIASSHSRITNPTSKRTQKVDSLILQKTNLEKLVRKYLEILFPKWRPLLILTSGKILIQSPSGSEIQTKLKPNF